MGNSRSIIRSVHGALPPGGVDKLVIYDGVCNLCNGTVKFIIARDPGKVFRFVALQSAAAAPILAHYDLGPEEALDSIVFVDDGIAYRKSAAALRIASYLPAPFSWLPLTAVVPSPLRDCVYGCVAANRYRVFGQSDECLMPSRDVMSRFLDAQEYLDKRKSARANALGVAAAASPAPQTKKDA